MNGGYENLSVEVIIPVKNGEKYIRDSVGSVLLQTHRNMRVLIVDDGSTDKTAEICDEIAAKHDNVRVYHTESRGVSAARNHGIEHAEGDFIAFLDADDYAARSCYGTLLRNAMENDCEISACGYFRTPDRNFDMRSEGTVRTTVFDDVKKALENMVNDTDSMEGFVWNKLYRRNAVKGVRFGDYTFCEDCIYSWDAVCSVKKICFTTEKLIYYFTSYKIYKPTEDGVRSYACMIERAKILGLSKQTQYTLRDGYVHQIVFMARNIALYKGKDKTITKERARELLDGSDHKRLHLTFSKKVRIFWLRHWWFAYKLLEKFIYMTKRGKSE